MKAVDDFVVPGIPFLVEIPGCEYGHGYHIHVIPAPDTFVTSVQHPYRTRYY